MPLTTINQLQMNRQIKCVRNASPIIILLKLKQLRLWGSARPIFRYGNKFTEVTSIDVQSLGLITVTIHEKSYRDVSVT